MPSHIRTETIRYQACSSQYGSLLSKSDWLFNHSQRPISGKPMSKKLRSPDWLFNVTCNDISFIYMWRLIDVQADQFEEVEPTVELPTP